MVVLGSKWFFWSVESEVEDWFCVFVMSKDYCVMYSLDGSSFEVLLVYFGMLVFVEFLWMFYEEFGFVSYGWIMFFCDVVVVEYVMCFFSKGFLVDVEKVFLSIMVVLCYYVSCIVIVLFVGVSY